MLHVYDDGYGFATVGWGHRTSLPLGMPVTQEQADEWLTRDLQWAEDTVEQWVAVPLTDNQFAALVCFTFNIGTSGFYHSALRGLLNAGNFDGAALQFSRWVHVKGSVSPGLVTRRSEELALFQTP